MTLERIIVAVDGSENSLVALRWAVDLASAVHAEVVAVHALGLLEQLDVGEPVPSQPNREDIQRQFEVTWCEPLEQAGVACRRVLRDGNPVTVLLDVAEEEDADLVVLGSRGLGGYPEALLGSTSTQVAQRSTRPVTIVPGP
jgi:nucleotide-binding universal stress UspA family protein